MTLDDIITTLRIDHCPPGRDRCETCAATDRAIDAIREVHVREVIAAGRALRAARGRAWQ